jgi:hypothetical protein
VGEVNQEHPSSCADLEYRHGELLPSSRIVSHFSCGAASAVATKLALAEYPPERVVILRAWILEEHEDNDRFSADCERWFGHPITVLRDEKYGASAIEVFKAKRYLKGLYGAPCRKALKSDVLEAAGLPGDVWVLGYTAEEEDRLNEFLDANNGQQVICPLIKHGLMKSDCLAMVERAGIELPKMYQLGYNNNNCRCCVKGGEGYFNRQRVDFPEHFAALADVQESIGPGAFLFRDRKTGERFSLRNLPPDKGRHKEPEISCSFYCVMAEELTNPEPLGRGYSSPPPSSQEN